MNRIVQGENLSVLRALASESIPLIYIDPPFNTGKRQVRPRLKTIRDDAGDRTGFGGARYRTETSSESLAGYLDSFDDYIGFLRPRIQEAHRIFTPTGSSFLHVDPPRSAVGAERPVFLMPYDSQIRHRLMPWQPTPFLSI